MAAVAAAAALSLLLVLSGYTRTQENLTKRTLEQSLNYLSQVNERIGGELEKMCGQLVAICKEPEIFELCTQPVSVTRLLNAEQRLQRCGALGEIVSEVALFFPEKDYHTLTTRQIITNLPLHYSAEMLTFRQLPFETLMDEIHKTSQSVIDYHYFPAQEMALYDVSSGQYISYWMRLSIPGIQQQPVAMALIDADQISQDIRELFSDASGLRITDTSGQVLLLSGSQPKGGWEASGTSGRTADGTVLSLEPSFPGGLTLSLFLPDSWIQNSIQPISHSIRLYLVLMLALGAAACVLAALYTSRPLRRIAHQVQLAISAPPAVRLSAEVGVSRLIDTNRKLKNQLTDWEPVIRAGLLERLYKGGILEEGEAKMLLDFENTLPQSFCAGVLCWKPYPGQQRPFSAEEVLQQVACRLSLDFGACFIHPFRSDQISFITDASSGREALEARLHQLLSGCAESGLLFSLGLSGKHRGLDEIYTSCMEARGALNGIPDWSRNRLAWYQPSDRQREPYQFLSEEQNSLCAYILAGESLLVRRQLELVYQRNFAGRELMEEDVIRFYQDLHGIYEKCADQLEPCRPAPEITHLARSAAVRDAFLSTFTEMAAQAGSARLRERNDLMRQILLFVDRHYSDSGLSLRMVADTFHMTDKYLSMFFKENAAVKFSEYVEQKRMAEAERLLSETKLSISDIQEQVGYATSNTFYKAFKRKYGVSPSVWRENNVG